MHKATDFKATFCRRLKQARLAAGLSQKALGIAAGIDEFVASTRINRYERGIHEADIATANRLANSLGVPLVYLYAENDNLAEIILAFPALPQQEQELLIQKLRAPKAP